MKDIVLVTGASGFIGSAVVRALLKEGVRVRAFTRSATLTFDDPRVEVVRGDMRDPDSLQAAMTDVIAVVHAAALKNDEKESEDVNVRGAMHLIEACKEAGVRRIVNIGTQSAKLEKKGVYGSTKLRADALLHSSPIPTVTLRCSLIYAEELSGVFGAIVRFSALPFIPIFGDGSATYRPLHRDDLASIVLRALRAPDIDGRTFDVGGPDLLTLNELTEAIMGARGITRPIVHVPVSIGIAAARIARVLPHPPITVSNVLGGAQNSPMDMAPFDATFGDIPVRSFAQGLTELFGMPADREAAALSAYVLSSVGRFSPDRRRIDLLKRALAAHGLDAPLPAARVMRSRFALGSYDAASRIACPHCLLQQKLLVAAAIAEVQPESAQPLLPRNRSRTMLLLRAADLCASALWKMIRALPLLAIPSRLKRHVGAF